MAKFAHHFDFWCSKIFLSHYIYCAVLMKEMVEGACCALKFYATYDPDNVIPTSSGIQGK